MIRRYDRRLDAMPLPFEAEQALNDHMAAIHELLVDIGHRPFWELELRMPRQAFDCEVVYRWKRDEPSTQSPRTAERPG